MRNLVGQRIVNSRRDKRCFLSLGGLTKLHTRPAPLSIMPPTRRNNYAFPLAGSELLYVFSNFPRFGSPPASFRVHEAPVFEIRQVQERVDLIP